MNRVLRPLLGQTLGLGLLFGGFWLLYLGFQRPSAGLGVLGGALILAGMWALVRVRGKSP